MFKDTDRPAPLSRADLASARMQLMLAGLRHGMRALDVGCGKGDVTHVMAGIAGAAQVTGVEAAAHPLALARDSANAGGGAARFDEGHAYALPYEAGSFDFVWSRLRFAYLSEPQRALDEMIRVARPGGTVAVADLDAHLEHFYPLDEPLMTLLPAVYEDLERQGFDRRVGRKLFGWMVTSGLEDIAVHIRPYQVSAGGVSEADQASWNVKFAAASTAHDGRPGPSVGSVSVGLEAARRAFFARRDLFFYSTLVLVRARKPAGIIRGPISCDRAVS